MLLTHLHVLWCFWALSRDSPLKRNMLCLNERATSKDAKHLWLGVLFPDSNKQKWTQSISGYTYRLCGYVTVWFLSPILWFSRMKFNHSHSPFRNVYGMYALCDVTFGAGRCWIRCGGDRTIFLWKKKNKINQRHVYHHWLGNYHNHSCEMYITKQTICISKKQLIKDCHLAILCETGDTSIPSMSTTPVFLLFLCLQLLTKAYLHVRLESRHYRDTFSSQYKALYPIQMHYIVHKSITTHSLFSDRLRTSNHVNAFL